MRAWGVGLAALLVTAGAAEARMHHPYRGHRIVAAASGPLDTFAQPSGAYSFRRLRTAYSGFAVKLQRVDTTTQDIGFVGNDFDTAAATAFCTTACTINTWYDQSGNARHLTQATAANQPQLVLGCIGTRPCAEFTDVSVINAGNVTGTVTASFSAVANKTVGTGSSIFFRQNGNAGNRITAETATLWLCRGGTSGNVNRATTLNTWHVGQCVVNGASSSLTLDGATTAGTTVGITTNAAYGMTGTAAQVHRIGEAVAWDTYLLTPAEIAALSENQRDYWIPHTLDAFVAPSGAYSFRKLKSTYSGPAIRIRRASDNLETDIDFLGYVPGLGSPWDEAAANAHCAATSCFVKTWYDQSGAARDLTNATTSTQPQLIFSCNGSLPCLETVSGSTLSGPNVTPATGVVSLAAVYNRTVGTAQCQLIRQNAANNRIVTRAGAAGASALSAVGTIATVITEAAWHSVVAVINGATSSITGDTGTPGTGSVTGNVTMGVVSLQGAAATTCRQNEAIVWDNYVITASETTALIQNQRSYGLIP
jgi:hypothetical protein